MSKDSGQARSQLASHSPMKTRNLWLSLIAMALVSCGQQGSAAKNAPEPRLGVVTDCHQSWVSMRKLTQTKQAFSIVGSDDDRNWVEQCKPWSREQRDVVYARWQNGDSAACTEMNQEFERLMSCEPLTDSEQAKKAVEITASLTMMTQSPSLRMDGVRWLSEPFEVKTDKGEFFTCSSSKHGILCRPQRMLRQGGDLNTGGEP